MAVLVLITILLLAIAVGVIKWFPIIKLIQLIYVNTMN